jgi:hypothetical protein
MALFITINPVYGRRHFLRRIFYTYRSDLNKKLPDRNKKLRYVGYQRACDSNQRACVTSIDTLQAKQLNDRLSKAANLYDGWFSRNVENLDLAPSHSRVSFSSVKGLT